MCDSDKLILLSLKVGSAHPVQVDVLRQAGLQVDVVLPPNFERGVSLCIDGAATKPVKFGVLGRTVLKGGHNI